jgi:hypothetical protein
MRTKHTFNCAISGKEHRKDWLYRGEHDDDHGEGREATLGEEPG